MIRVKTATKCKPRGKPSESKAMGLCLEAEHEPAAVKLPIESDLYGRGRTKEVVEAFESDGFASLGSPRG
jgi:hypothetical protein